MNRFTEKNQARLRRHRRIRTQIVGTASRPRLSVRKTVKHMHAQLIDDARGVTLVHVTDAKMKGTKSERAQAVGQALAEAAKAKKITNVVFDRGGAKFQGRVKALAEGARTAGLTF